ncbi:MAG TPA: outer membrane beta-barrel protein, partial [Candidatus Cloacimonadota bacterium]|nr:outer membrane beta-barrel protein [Candidatus Cloacimonadota bacterium]
MKSFVLIPLILVAFVSVLSAIPNGGMVFGIGSVGFTGSDVTNSENAGIDYANKIGFYGGVFFKSQSTNDFLLRTEVTLTERGSNVTFDDYDGLSGSMNLWYLSVPLTFMYNFPAVKSPNFYMGVGPALNIAISGTEKVTDGTDTASGEITDQMNP